MSLSLRALASSTCLAAVSLALLAATPAAAAPLLYTFTGGLNGTFRYDLATASPFIPQLNRFRTNYTNGTGDFAYTGPGPTLEMFTQAFGDGAGGGIRMRVVTASSGGYVVLNGTTSFFTGSTGSPVLSQGTFSLQTSTGTPVTLRVAPPRAPGAPAPEVGASWAAAVAAGLALALTRLRRGAPA